MSWSHQESPLQYPMWVFLSACLCWGYVSPPASATSIASTPNIESKPVRESSASAGKSESAIQPSGSGKVETPELSVAPLDHVQFPKDRPDWLAEPPQLTSSLHRWPVVTPPCDSPDSADELIKIMSRAAVDSYIERITGVTSQEIEFNIEDDWIERELIADRYFGEIMQGDAPVYESAVLLRFRPNAQSAIQAAWRNHEIRNRIGLIGVSVVGMLGIFAVGSSLLSTVGHRIQKKQQTTPLGT
jgi:hypothetical protein